MSTDEAMTECAYCGREMPAEPEEARPPAVSDEVAWRELAAAHAPGCEWVETRAHRQDAETGERW